MSLIISLRIPDGVVIAGDSLSTMRRQVPISQDLEFECPNCGEVNTGSIDIGMNVPTSTFSYAQKVFPFMGKFGVGTYGAGQLSGKTMYYAVRELEQELENDEDTPMDTVTDVADTIGERVHELVQDEVGDLEQIPEDGLAVGFLVTGYDQDEGKTIQVNVGREIHIQTYSEPGCTWGGDGHVVQAVWSLFEEEDGQQPAFHLFSLQDAIDYAEFLISTTANHQQFSSKMASVGGAIDVALVTPFDGFQWIQQKDLSQTLEGQRYE